MKTIQVIAGAVFVIMCANVVNVAVNSGMDHGVGLDTFLVGLRSPWTNFIGTDLVMGLVFSLSWLVFRERGNEALATIAWVWMAAWWGNIVIAVYVLKAAREAGGDWSVFFMGRHAPAGVMQRGWARPLPLRWLCLAGAVLVALYMVYGVVKCKFSALPTLGYLAGFLPVTLTLALLGRPVRAG